MSRIALNGIGNYVGGVEAYIYNLTKEVLEKDQVNSYFLFVSTKQESEYKDLLEYRNLRIISYKINFSNPILRILCENTLFLFDIYKYQIDLVHHLCNYIPFISPYKSVVTVHDLASFYYHNNFPEYKETRLSYNYFKKVFNYMSRRAEKIITVSEFSKQELLDNFKVDKTKIVAVGAFCDIRHNFLSANSDKLDKFGISKPYILSVSVSRPHKNFDFLVRVFNTLKLQYKLPHKLVIVGGVHFGAEKFFAEIAKSPFKDDIIYTGNIDAEDLASIYTFADLFVFPSLYEGFGLPTLEAMLFKIPVIASNAASIPEVGRDACVYFDPHDENDACTKILAVLNVKTLRNNLIFSQKSRLDYYSRKNVATRIVNVYNEILGRKNG